MFKGMDMYYIVVVLLSLSNSFGQRLEIPAYEYLRRFQRPLILGQCPDRFISYSWGEVREQCTYPKRTGDVSARSKNVDFVVNTALSNVSHLFSHFALCDEKAANYLGILSRGDCVAAEMASKLSFKRKTSTRMYLEHYRPVMNILSPTIDLDIPGEFSLYLNNTYYTENIGIGTEEVVIMEMSFASVEEARKADNLVLSTSKLLSVYLRYIARHIAIPKKIKIIRHSTSDQVLRTYVYKGTAASIDTEKMLLECEGKIRQIRLELKAGIRSSHLRYGFKEYEIPKGPYFLPSQTVTDADRRRSWEDVTLLQIDATRVYVTYKRYRKLCRSIKDIGRACPVIKQSLRELKNIMNRIQSERKSWQSISYEIQQQFILRGKQTIKNIKVTLKVVVKSLKKNRRGRRRKT